MFFAMLSGPPLCAAGPDNYHVQQIAAHTFVWVPDDIVDQSGDPYFSRAGNVGFVITSDGVVVLDASNNPFSARDVLYEIRQRTDLPVRLVIDLGAQGDQMLGNEVFAEQRALIVSSADTEAAMREYHRDLANRLTFDPELPVRMRGIHFTLPSQTFRGQKTFTLGGVAIHVAAVNCGPPGVPTGDAVAYLPQEKVLFLGDLYVNHFVPQIGSRDVGCWIRALGQLEKQNALTYVPGHGNPGPGSGVAAFRGFLEWLNASVKAGVDQGKSLSDVEQKLLSSSAFNLLALDLAPRTIAAVYHQVMNARSAQASPRGAPPLHVPLDRGPTASPAPNAQGFGSLPTQPVPHP